MSLASQLPRYQRPKSLEEALVFFAQTFSPSWVMKPVLASDTVTVSVSTCFVREVCRKGNIALGGDLCKLFSNYLVGYLSKAARIRPRLTGVVASEENCVYTIKIHENKS
jgi:hypothetical protein